MERTVKIISILAVSFLLFGAKLNAFVPENTDIKDAQKIMQEIKRQSREIMKQRQIELVKRAEKIQKENRAEKQTQNNLKSDKKQKQHQLMIIPYWLQVIFAILFLGTITMILLPQYKKQKTNGMTLVELLIGLGMMITILLAVSVIFLRGQIIMNKLGTVMDTTNQRQLIFNTLSKEFRQAGTDTSHTITLSEGNSHLSFYRKSIASDGEIEWIGPVEIFLSADKLVRKIGTTTYVISSGVSNLTFANTNDFISATFTIDGKTYTVRVKSRAET